jgi:hypothetical protein
MQACLALPQRRPLGDLSVTLLQRFFMRFRSFDFRWAAAVSRCGSLVNQLLSIENSSFPQG